LFLLSFTTKTKQGLIRFFCRAELTKSGILDFFNLIIGSIIDEELESVLGLPVRTVFAALLPEQQEFALSFLSLLDIHWYFLFLFTALQLPFDAFLFWMGLFI
jgi:hypothetical protein